MMMPRSAANAAASRYTRMLASRTRSASSQPTSPAAASKSMFSSCAPASALVEGVKMTSGSRSACLSPGGKRIPHTVPVR